MGTTRLMGRGWSVWFLVGAMLLAVVPVFPAPVRAGKGGLLRRQHGG